MISASVVEYWRIYGGWRALFSSGYFIASEVAILWAMYLTDPSGEYLQDWPALGVSIIPGMLGFSLGALTIFMTLADGPTIDELRDGGSSDSLFMNIIVTLFHFILVQVVALTLSLLGSLVPTPLVVVVAMWLTFYSIFCGLAAAIVVLGIGRLRNLGG